MENCVLEYAAACWEPKQPNQVGSLEQGTITKEYTAGEFVWCDRPFYLVKQPQEKWACDFYDDALPLSFQLQVAEVKLLKFKTFNFDLKFY